MAGGRRRFLMVHWDGAGNLPPQRALAREMIRRGHEVHILSHDSVAKRMAADGATFHPLPTAPQTIETEHPETGLEELRVAARLCWFNAAFAEDFLTVTRAVAPDALIIDATLRCVQAVAADIPLPAVIMGHTIYTPRSPGGLFDQIAAPEDTPMIARADGWAKERLTLIPSYAAFNPLPHVPANVRHVGPIREAVESRPWPRAHTDRALVLVSLSTSFMNQAPLLQRLCDALAPLTVEALITTGPAMAPEQFTAPDHIALRQFIPHDEILPFADLAITHCGHGTVMAAAGAGAPLLCLPMGRDQPFVAGRVEALGLRRTLDPTSPAEAIGAAVREMLGDAGWKARAESFAAGVERFGDLRGAGDAVEAVRHQQVGSAYPDRLPS